MTQAGDPRRRPGFTLTELLIVMVIIGILIAFILRAAMDGVRRAEERATQATIAKIESGLTDRIEALLMTRADANGTHSYLAALWTSATTYIPDRPKPRIVANYSPTPPLPGCVSRAQVIAQFDRMRAELPDVFVLNDQGGSAPDPNYPINFAGVPYPYGTAVLPLLNSSTPNAALYSQYLLPLGIGILNDPTALSGTVSWGANPPGGLSAVNTSPVVPASTGIFGASYAAAGGLYQQLGATPQGYDGTDNNGNGLIDELSEGGLSLASPRVQTFTTNHTHKTARAEMLYAVLVNGLSPLGSVFRPDDFSDREVKDTDGDGLLEFVDAWGEPLQFFRWPIFYYGQDPIRPDVQRGCLPYGGPTAPRDQNPLDPNQQLLAPSWWSGDPSINPLGGQGPFVGTSPPRPLGGGAALFQSFFITLIDPHSNPALAPAAGTLWDRSALFTQRRAYDSRYLLLSAGPDKVPGVASLDTSTFQALGGLASSTLNGWPPFPTQSATTNTQLLLIENQAASFTVNRSDPLYQTPRSWTGSAVDQAIDRALEAAGADDITNQNLQAPGGAIP